MDDDMRSDITRSRDSLCQVYDLSEAVYGNLPSRAASTPPVRRSRAISPTRSLKHHSESSSLTIKLARSTANMSWLPNPQAKSARRHQMELHQSTCLNLNTASAENTESDLWILPDFDDWEVEPDVQNQQTTQKETGEWAPLLRRAAKSNLERLRARLEGDGWDFVGGKYGEEEKALKEEANLADESVDEEFDVVVLPVVRVGC